MKRHIYIFYSLLITLSTILSSCNSKVKVKSDTEEEFTYIHLIPDSLQTPEQKEFVNRLNKIISENTVIKDNHFKLTLSEDDFVKQGFQSEYYILIQKDYDTMNRFIDSMLIENPQMIWLDAVYEYNKRKGIE